MVKKAKLLLQGVKPEFIDFFLIKFNKQDLYDLARQKYGDIKVQFLDIWEKDNPFLPKSELIFYTANNRLQKVEKRE